MRTTRIYMQTPLSPLAGCVGEGTCGKAIKLAVCTLNHTGTTTNSRLCFTFFDFYPEAEFLRTSRCPRRGMLGTLKTPSCPWRGCPAAGQNLEAGHLSRHYIAEISLNLALNHKQQPKQNLMKLCRKEVLNVSF